MYHRLADSFGFMTQHIGIVACSAPGAALCYETICVEAERRLGGHHNPEVSLHMFDLAEHVRFLEQDDWNGIADLMIRSVRKVAASGADFAICPDNTICGNGESHLIFTHPMAAHSRSCG